MIEILINEKKQIVDTPTRTVLVHKPVANTAERNRSIGEPEAVSAVRELANDTAGEPSEPEQARVPGHPSQPAHRDTRVHLLAHVALVPLLALQPHPRGPSRYQESHAPPKAQLAREQGQIAAFHYRLSSQFDHARSRVQSFGAFA